jgi:hypothetical protein
MAEKIQRELVRRLPGDPVISEFSKYLPSEALAQRKALNGENPDDEEEEDYYDEEAEKEAAAKEEEYDKEEPEEPET